MDRAVQVRVLSPSLSKFNFDGSQLKSGAAMQPYSRQDRQVTRRVLVVVRVSVNSTSTRRSWQSTVDAEMPRKRVHVQGSRRRRYH